MSYNGWTNYETWATCLHFADEIEFRIQQIINESGSKSIAKNCFDNFQENMEFFIKNQIDFDNISPFASDIFAVAFERVNWREIFDLYLEQAEEIEEVNQK